MEKKHIVVEREIAGRTLRMETGKMAKQASAAVMVQYGDTCVLTAVVEQELRAGFDFFPLLVDYRERGSAAGQIWGGRFMKREGRPSEKEILTCRLIDRPVRPLFPEGFMRDVLIQATVFSADPENDPDLCAMIGASAALSLSTLPWDGPTGSVRIGRVGEELVVNPTYHQRADSSLDLVMSAKRDAIAMVEAGAHELPEATMLEALEKGHEVCRSIIEMVDEMVEQAQPQKMEFQPEEEAGLVNQLVEKYFEDAKQAASTAGKFNRRDALKELRGRIIEELVPAVEEGQDAPAGAPTEADVKSAFHELQAKAIRQLILDGKRCDGRANNEVRPITSEVTVLPRAHGSALFTRGETQSLCSVTLGTADDEQLVESLHGEYSMRFLLHYNFPSFCVGEVKPPRGPGRREIGHGNLARRSLQPVLPNHDSFPYTIRIISDILESNGSSSMASVCGGTLAMMDAGVPLKDPVAGIAMGLVLENGEHRVITDILGDEDHYGDMDFKVAGTQHGITALQMDIKVAGISADIMREALDQAKEGRIHILKKMLETLQAPRAEIPTHAPRIMQMKIDPDLIGKVIGPGGKMIRGIEEQTGATLNIDDDGTVTIASADGEAAKAALDWVERIVEKPKIGKIYEGPVKSIRDFGIFVEILPGQDGMVHISELDTGYVKNAGDVVDLGDIVRVKLTAIDDQGRVRLSRKAVIEEEQAEQEEETETAD